MMIARAFFLCASVLLSVISAQAIGFASGTCPIIHDTTVLIRPIYVSTVVEYATVFTLFDQLVISATNAPTTIIISTSVTSTLLPVDTR